MTREQLNEIEARVDALDTGFLLERAHNWRVFEENAEDDVRALARHTRELEGQIKQRDNCDEWMAKIRDDFMQLLPRARYEYLRAACSSSPFECAAMAHELLGFLSARIAELEAVARWIQTSERLPEPKDQFTSFSNPVLLEFKGEVVRGYFDHNSQEWNFHSTQGRAAWLAFDVGEVTQWRPLPDVFVEEAT